MRDASLRIWCAIVLLEIGTMNAYSDEGMWLFNEPPRERLKTKYDFDLTPKWLDQVRLASIRFNNGGSGSFVSPDGLIITNHHIGSDSLQKLSTPKKDLFHDGFFAKSREEELKCPDLELNILVSIEDVTEAVNRSVKEGMKSAEAFAARRGKMSEIEKESTELTKLRSDVVTLYQGGAYHLYRYKKYTDIRLVMAPEHGIAFFGGDTDNFEFPRYNLDICFFRAYENDQPVRPDHYLKFSKVGPKENDLVFVIGNPGTTNRLETLQKLEHRRDKSHPYQLMRLRTFEAAMLQYAERGPEERRQAGTDIHRFANARKAFAGQFQGLLDPQVLAQKKKAEEELIEGAKKIDSPSAVTVQNALKTIAEVQDKLAMFEKEYFLIERGDAFVSELFGIARHIVRMTEETAKPSAARLREYRDSNLESLKFQLFSPAPIYPELERVKIVTGVTFLAEQLGAKHALVQKVLGGRSPAKLANDLLSGTKLADPAERKRLVEGGVEAVSQSQDSMIRFVRDLDEEARKRRKMFEEEIEEPERQAFADLARIRFAVYGRAIAPDATFTLRLAYGTVKGYAADGKDIPFATTYGGLFERAKSQEYREPFSLPKAWIDVKDKLDPTVPFNFASTADTIGGNSGSPVINRAGEFVGINFDRNRHGLVRNFVYTDVQARHISVHSAGILHALKARYGYETLIAELTGK